MPLSWTTTSQQQMDIMSLDLYELLNIITKQVAFFLSISKISNYFGIRKQWWQFQLSYGYFYLFPKYMTIWWVKWAWLVQKKKPKYWSSIVWTEMAWCMIILNSSHINIERHRYHFVSRAIALQWLTVKSNTSTENPMGENLWHRDTARCGTWFQRDG